MWHTHAVEYDSALKTNVLPTPVNLEDTRRREISKSRKVRLCVTLLTGGARRSQTHRGGSRGWVPGAAWGAGSECLTWTGFQFGSVESSGDGRWCWLLNSVNVLTATELCT